MFFGGTGFAGFYEYWYSIIKLQRMIHMCAICVRKYPCARIRVYFDLLRGDLWNFDLISNNKMVHKFIWPSLQTFIPWIIFRNVQFPDNQSFLSHFMMAPSPIVWQSVMVILLFMSRWGHFQRQTPYIPPIRFLISSSSSSKRLSLS